MFFFTLLHVPLWNAFILGASEVSVKTVIIIIAAAWSARYVTDEELEEQIQRRLTCVVPGMNEVPY